jgi:hypothetical protein
MTEIPDDRIPPYGARLRCSSCSHLMDVPPREEPAFLIPLGAGEAKGRDDGERLPAPRAREPVRGERATERDRVEELHVDAKRLARVLITDIAYADSNRLSEARSRRAVLQVYAPEIRKAWDFYRGRVGETLARESGYFREAIETILAGR